MVSLDSHAFFWQLLEWFSLPLSALTLKLHLLLRTNSKLLTIYKNKREVGGCGGWSCKLLKNKAKTSIFGSYIKLAAQHCSSLGSKYGNVSTIFVKQLGGVKHVIRININI